MTAWSEDDLEDGGRGEHHVETVEDGPIDWATTKDMRALRAKAREYDELQIKGLLAQRENALLRSEVDLESSVGQLFYKSYTGDWTPQAVREEAARYGVPFKTTGPPKPESTAEPRPYAVAEDHLEGWGPRR